MKTCIHDDCVIVWEEYRSNGDDVKCPCCEIIDEKKRLEKENEKLQRQVEDYEEREDLNPK